MRASAASSGHRMHSHRTAFTRPSFLRSRRTTVRRRSMGPILCPRVRRARRALPLIMNPYGGPGPETCANRWGDSLLFDQVLTDHGFAVLHADNRGSGMRGRDFAQAAYHNFGPVQLEISSRCSMLRWPNIRNSTRTASVGGMELGAARLRCTPCRTPTVFRAGVAVAPVTDWGTTTRSIRSGI